MRALTRGGALARFGATVRLDLMVQRRSRLWVLGVFVAGVLGLMVRGLVPVAHVGRGLAAFYVVGLGGTTFMFGASMLLLEKGEGTLQALRIAPMRTADYLASKAVTLAGFALVESLVVYAIAARGAPTSPVPLLVGVAVLGLFYTWVGLGMAASHRAVTTFLLPWGTLVAMVLQLPFLSLLDVGPWWLWHLIPSQAPMLLVLGAFEPLAGWQWAYATLMSAAMLLGAWGYAAARFRRHIRFPELA